MTYPISQAGIARPDYVADYDGRRAINGKPKAGRQLVAPLARLRIASPRQHGLALLIPFDRKIAGAWVVIFSDA
jgi:hypothetical protein